MTQVLFAPLHVMSITVVSLYWSSWKHPPAVPVLYWQVTFRTYVLLPWNKNMFCSPPHPMTSVMLSQPLSLCLRTRLITLPELLTWALIPDIDQFVKPACRSKHLSTLEQFSPFIVPNKSFSSEDGERLKPSSKPSIVTLIMFMP